MADLYLQEMMKGPIQSNKQENKKNRFDLAMDKQLDEWVGELSVGEESPQDALVTPQMQRMRLKEAVRKQIALDWLIPYVAEAFALLQQDNQGKLAPQQQQLLVEISAINERLQQLDLEIASTDNFKILLAISDGSMSWIAQRALESFNVGNYGSSAALFALLAALDPDNPDYWFRMAIAAHHAVDLPLALQGYAITAQLSPTEIAPRLLAAECHITLDQREAAEVEYRAAKEIAGQQEVNQEWLDLLSRIEGVILA